VPAIAESGEATLKSGKLRLVSREEIKALYSVTDRIAGKGGKAVAETLLEKSSTQRLRIASTGAILAAIEESSVIQSPI